MSQLLRLVCLVGGLVGHADAFSSLAQKSPPPSPPIGISISPPAAPLTLDDHIASTVSALAASFDQARLLFGEASADALAEAVLNEVPDVQNYTIRMLSYIHGMEHWRNSVPPVDFTIAKFFDFSSHTANDPNKIDKITEQLFSTYSPEAASYLPRNDDMTLVREMIDLPTDGNDPENVTFPLPAFVPYTGPSDLYYMSLQDLAALIHARNVSCVEVVTAFKERIEEFDRYLGMVTISLFDSALATAAEYDGMLAAGTSKGPLMCLPFGMKDHHQIDDEPTTYGHILYYKSVQTVKSTVMAQLIKYGAIPIAKLSMGTLATGSVTGWGEVMSPYLNGNSGGSSCGSGAALAIGAISFAVSEETWGSIASPAARNLVSGHIPSYGGTSRAGAGLLSSETDHIGFHARYLKDFAFLYNHMRTGIDPLDGDTVKVNFKNPHTLDLSTIRVLIVTGDAKWEYDEARSRWSWSADSVPNSYSLTAWKWPERVQRIMAALDAAGIPYETKNETEMASAFEDYSQDPLFPDPTVPGGWLNILWQFGGGAAAFLQQGQAVLENSRRKNRGCRNCTYPKNIPMKSFRAVQYGMSHFGRKFLQDAFWSNYDVVIHSNSGNVPGYQAIAGNFEQWVRTSKTFVIDYLKETPCMHTSGGTVSGTYATLTALPFKDHLSFAVGEVIQEFPAIKELIQAKPNEAAVKATFADRARCPGAFYEGFTLESCPEVNTPDGPPYPPGREPSMGSACRDGHGSQHVPTAFGAEPYIPPYLMDDPMPDRGVWKYDVYAVTDVCATFCKFVPSYCEHKGWATACESARRQLEAGGPRREGHATVALDEAGKPINWNTYIDPEDPEFDDKN